MNWRDLPIRCRAFLLFVYGMGILSAVACFSVRTEYSRSWILAVFASLFLAGINLRLPQNPSVVISMGDVFTILVLLHFGASPALLTYWANVTAAAFNSYVKTYGRKRFWKKVLIHRFVFNLACCSLSVSLMAGTLHLINALHLGKDLNFVLSVASITVVWFVVNTGTLSVAVALTSHRKVFSVWTDGLGLYLMSFLGSGAAAGLISVYYERASAPIFVFSIPIAIIVYYVHLFYIQKVQQAESHLKKLNDIFLQTIEAMAMSVDAKDRYTHGHIRRVQIFANELARCCGVTDERELMALKAGALLHDIGKIAIPEYILNKPTVLTASEFEKMKLHPVVGANILKNIEFPYPVMPAVRSHHERWDGKGYPDGLQGEQIPLIARILSLVDCYDALTTDRPYRSPMKRVELEDFFRREAGKAYDPTIVDTFLKNLDQLEAAEKAAALPIQDIWGIREVGEANSNSIRPLERVQPTITYGKALRADARIQRELYSVFEFTQCDIHGLERPDVLDFMARRLENVVRFDAGAFFMADLEAGEIAAAKVVGKFGAVLEGVKLRLEQKLTGWVAANNQSLSNLPPFPDFLSYPDIGKNLLISAIAPINASGNVLGAISLYRTSSEKFTEEEFRRLELIASQTATAFSRIPLTRNDEPILFDGPTGLPNAFQLHLMFDQITTDAKRYDYSLALLTIHVENTTKFHRRFGFSVNQDAFSAAAGTLRGELRDTDLLTRCGPLEFVVLSPASSRDQAEALKSRIQDVLDRSSFNARPDLLISFSASVGIAIFPEDGSSLRELISCAENRMNDDRELRAAVKHVRPLPLEQSQPK